MRNTTTCQERAGADYLEGVDGNDSLYAGGSVLGIYDLVYGGPGDDVIYNFVSPANLTGMTAQGGEGNDAIFGSDQHDLILGDAGNDTIAGRGGTDELFGGLGDACFTAGWTALSSSWPSPFLAAVTTTQS